MHVPHHASSNRRRSLGLTLAIGVALSVGATYVLLTRVSVEDLLPLIGSTDLLWVGAAIASLGVSMVVRTVRWRIVYPVSRSGPRPGTAALLPIVLVGYALNQLLPLRLGDLGRGVAAARRFGSGLPEVLGSVGLERLLDAAALGVVAVIASMGLMVPGWLTLTAIGILIVVAIVIGSFYAVEARLKRVQQSTVARVVHGLRSSPRSIVASMGVGIIAWCLDGVTVWLIASSVGLALTWQTAILVTVGAALGTVLPSAPAAIGTFHLAGTAVAVALGIAPEQALAIVTLWHAATVIPMVIAGLASASAIGLRSRELRGASRISSPGGILGRSVPGDARP